MDEAPKKIPNKLDGKLGAKPDAVRDDGLDAQLRMALDAPPPATEELRRRVLLAVAAEARPSLREAPRPRSPRAWVRRAVMASAVAAALVVGLRFKGTADDPSRGAREVVLSSDDEHFAFGFDGDEDYEDGDEPALDDIGEVE